MDRVRFGRALGYGARHAAKTVMAAAEAAAAPDPAQAPSIPTQPPQSEDTPGLRRRPTLLPPVRTERVAEVVTAARHGVAGARAASGGVIAPVRRFSAVLWLEVTGAFFALMALTFAGACWRFRAGFRPAADVTLRHHAWTFAALLALFGYFSVSSFVRAGRRGRR